MKNWSSVPAELGRLDSKGTGAKAQHLRSTDPVPLPGYGAAGASDGFGPDPAHLSLFRSTTASLDDQLGDSQVSNTVWCTAVPLVLKKAVNKPDNALNQSAELAVGAAIRISAHEMLLNAGKEPCSNYPGVTDRLLSLHTQLQAQEFIAAPVSLMAVSFKHQLVSSNTADQFLKFINIQ